MKRPTRCIRVLGALSLVLSLLVGAFGVSSVAAQAPEDPFGPVVGAPGVYFPWVANDDASTGLGPADTSITIQNLDATDATIFVYRGIGTSGLGGDNGWDIVGPFTLEAHASKTFSAAQLGIAAGEGAPIAVVGYTFTGEVASGNIADYNQDGDYNDYETIADADFPYNSGSNSWTNTSPAEEVSWSDGDCLVVDIDPDPTDPTAAPNINVYPAGYDDGGAVGIPGGTYPGQPGGNLDGNPANCVAAEAEDASDVIAPSNLGGVAKQAVDGENLPYTSDADSAVSGYTGLAGWELVEVGNESGPFNGWYLPIVQTNGGPGGAWNSIIRVANFGDGGGTIGAAGVIVTFYPADNAAGELNQSFSVPLTLNAGETQAIDLSDHVPEGWIGSAHISSDGPVFAMVDRVKVGYTMWLTNTASNALVTAEANAWGQGGKFVLYAPDVRKDFFGWNTGINVANLADHDNTVTIQYLGDIGASAQTTALHAKGMTYFYDPSQAPQDNNQQDPTTDHTTNSGEIGAAILIADYPIAAAIDATKYPESTSSSDPNIFQGLSYHATQNLWFDQAVPLVQKGNPNTGMGATSGIQLFNPLDVSSTATVTWYLSSGDTAGNPIPVVINPNAMTFVYTMNDAQLSVGFLGSATIRASNPIAVVSTQVDYQVQFDGSAVWNGYNPAGAYRDQGPQPDSILDVFTYLTPLDELPVPEEAVATDANLAQAPGDVAIGGVTVYVYAENDCGGIVLDSGMTDANGEVEFSVDPGYYCVSADPNGDGTMTFVDHVYIEPGDTDLDVDAVIVEEGVVAIMDVAVDGAQCTDLVEEVSTPVLCDESTTGEATSVTTVYYLPVADLNALCADLDYSGAENATYNPSDNTYEATVLPGYYCAMADMDGDVDTVDRIYSLSPFLMPSGDDGEDFANADEHLTPLAVLDVLVNGDFGGEIGVAGMTEFPVEIFAGAEIEDGLCAGVSMGTFITQGTNGDPVDEFDGIVSIPVQSGDYCAQADVNNDLVYTAVTGNVPLGDPSFADNGDVDITIVEAVTFLDVYVTLNEEPLAAETQVQIHAGTGVDGTTGLCSGDLLYTLNTGEILYSTSLSELPGTPSQATVFAAPGDYCAQADPDGLGTPTAGTGSIPAGDGIFDADITINESTLGVADIETSGPDCIVEGSPTECVTSNGEGMGVTILLIPVADSEATCPTDAEAYAEGTEAIYDVDGDDPAGTGDPVPPLHSWEATVPAGWYCAMANKDDTVYDQVPDLFSAEPFEVTIGDPENDWDENLGAYLDIVTQVNGDNPPDIVSVDVFLGACGTGTAIGTFDTDASGLVTTVVNPGDYCATADPNDDTEMTSVSGTVDIDDPDNVAGDVDITINEVNAA